MDQNINWELKSFPIENANIVSCGCIHKNCHHLHHLHHHHHHHDIERVGQIPLSFQTPVENSFPDSCQQSPHFSCFVYDDDDDDDDDYDEK